MPGGRVRGLATGARLHPPFVPGSVNGGQIRRSGPMCPDTDTG